MIDMLKRVAGKLPPTTQQSLKRYYFARQIKRGTFNTDEPEFERLKVWVSKGDWVLDIGANVGHYTAKLSELVGAQGRVIAFEPVPETFEILTANTARLQHRNVTLVNAAASDAACMLGMEVPMLAAGRRNYYRASIVDQGWDTSVYCLPVDALSIPAKVRLVKVDVEGHELKALSGMKELLQRDCPTLVVEGDSDAVSRYLHGLGYAFEKLHHSPNRIFTMQV